MQEDNTFEIKEKYGLYDLVSIMALLRAPGGCPWDREQTHKSIRKNLIEETYEVCEGIDKNDYSILCEELGDLLLQVVFHSQMAHEEGHFDIDDVADGICRKLIRRHPHIFGDVVVSGSGQVLDNWDKIKKAEKGADTTAADTMEHVFRGMPSLMRAQKVQRTAAKSGFDWDTASAAAEKLTEEKDELFAALSGGNADEIRDEAGDLLFAAVNVVRKCGTDSEEALELATDKFISRFAKVEALAAADGFEMQSLPLEKLDRYWDRVKAEQDNA